MDDGLTSFVDQQLGDALVSTKDCAMKRCPSFCRDGIEHQRGVKAKRRFRFAIENGSEVGGHPFEQEDAVLLLIVVLEEQLGGFKTTVETGVVEGKTTKS